MRTRESCRLRGAHRLCASAANAFPAALPPLLIALPLLFVAIPALGEPLHFSSPEGTARYSTDLLQLALGAVATFEFVGLLFLLGPTTWRGIERFLVRGVPAPGRNEWLALLGLTVGAFLLRVFLAEPSAILSTYNDVKHMHDAMCLSGTAHACELTPSYPLAVTSIHALVFRVFGPSLHATYWTNAVLGTLTVPLAWLLGTLLTSGRRSAGWFAAAALAGLPLHIRFSASGAFTIGLVFFLTLGAVFLLLFARTQRPRHLWVAALALALAFQSRFEAAAFAVPVLALTLLVAPDVWRHLVTRRIRLHIVPLVVLLVGAAAGPVMQLLSPNESLGFGGSALVGTRLAVAIAVPSLWFGLGRAIDFVPHARYLRWPLGIVTIVGLCLVLPSDYVPTHILPSPDPWPVFASSGLLVPSFADLGAPLLNVRAVTLPVMSLAFLGIAGGLHPERRGAVAVLWLWAGIATALGMQKFTGSIPFEHMRTAVDGTVAVAGLAALGGAALLDLVPDLRSGRRQAITTAALAGFLLTGPLFSLPMLRAGGFENQLQIDFLERTIPQLPDRAIVVYPNRTQPGEHRFAELWRIPEVWWTLGHAQVPRTERYVGTRSALASPDALVALREKGWTILFWEGLACYRTRGEPDERREDCEEMHWTFRMTPIAEQEIPLKPFESDFNEVYLITTDPVPLRVYRIDGLGR